jgi:hypothetical protein
MKAKPKTLESGASRFDFSVTVSIIAILASILLYSLGRTQRQIESAMLDTDVTNLRWELREAWAHRNVIGQSVGVNEIVGTNPMRLLAYRPQNYIGEYAQAPDATSVWYFDTHNKRLVYVFRDGHQARLRLASTANLGEAPLGAIGGVDLVFDSRSER